MTAGEQETILKEWLSAHSGVIFKVIRAYATDPEEQDDLFQEISIRLWNSIPKFEGRCAVSTWMYRISLNVSISWVRKEDRRRSESLDRHVLIQETEDEDPRIAWLYDEIRKMDEIDRSLSLLLLDGFSYREMSEILGISESNVGVKIHRIKKILVQRADKVSAHEY
jgi:RNA polymerase sigma-70 factor (ECF subfamily)